MQSIKQIRSRRKGTARDVQSRDLRFASFAPTSPKSLFHGSRRPGRPDLAKLVHAANCKTLLQGAKTNRGYGSTGLHDGLSVLADLCRERTVVHPELGGLLSFGGNLGAEIPQFFHIRP